VTLHDNTVKAFKPEQIPLVTERLKKLNNIVDAKAKIPKGTTLHLPRLYVVSPGQTLSAISTDVYGNTKKVDEIFAKNTPDPVKKKNELSPGMVLILP
jgi:nucleoid-associated protein YgaU